MMKTIYKIILSIALIMLLVGCTTGINTIKKFKFNQENLGTLKGDSIYTGGDVVRFIDTDYNNICYVYNAYKAGGISCVS